VWEAATICPALHVTLTFDLLTLKVVSDSHVTYATQWLKWFCEAGGGSSPDEARLEQTPYPFQPPLIWRYLGVK